MDDKHVTSMVEPFHLTRHYNMLAGTAPLVCVVLKILAVAHYFDLDKLKIEVQTTRTTLV